MSFPTHTLERFTMTLAVAVSGAAFAAAALAGGASIGDAGLVAGQLGSPDPHDAAVAWRASSHELVPALLGSPDPRDTNGTP